MSPLDLRLLRLALTLGERGNGRTWPNPSVGAVVTRPDGLIVAQGVTGAGGRPHAEASALAAAGAGARDATLYVSLEPCSHQGLTPPCADAILRAGVARVVTATDDPDPRVSGRGHARLREAGVSVETGLATAEAARAHRGHFTRVREGRPAVILKLARTLDGFSAGPPGAARLMISGAEAWARTHLLRAHSDAIMVGVSTVLADDPRLDVRLPGLEARSPIRVVLDSRLRLPLTSGLAKSASERPTWILCGPEAGGQSEARLSGLGISVIRVAADHDGRVDLRAALAALGERGLTRIFSEGGPTLADALAGADAVDELWLATGAAPLGAAGLPAVGPALGRMMWTMPLVSSERLGADLVERFERA